LHENKNKNEYEVTWKKENGEIIREGRVEGNGRDNNYSFYTSGPTQCLKNSSGRLDLCFLIVLARVYGL
jgi:hypothetical protein